MPLKGEGEPPSMEVGGITAPPGPEGNRLGEAAPPPETRGPRPEGILKALLEVEEAAAAEVGVAPTPPSPRLPN